MADYDRVKRFRAQLKLNLIYVMGSKCSVCGYNKCPAALEFHHINPNEKEFAISHQTSLSTEKALLEIQKCALLCANCHREVENGYIDIDQIHSTYDQDRANEIILQVQQLKEKKHYYCQDCGVEIDSCDAKRCVQCSQIARRVVNRPTREELKQLVYSTSFLQLGQQFGVSDKTISKWCAQYGLPSKRSEIKKYSQIEWETL